MNGAGNTHTLSPSDGELVNALRHLVERGIVRQRDAYLIESASAPGNYYRATASACTCPASHYRGARCKHQLTAKLATKLRELCGEAGR